VTSVAVDHGVQYGGISDEFRYVTGLAIASGADAPPRVGYHGAMTYQVLARRWRPQRFADLLGQEGVVQTLTNALDAETFGQAYLFSGLRGVGKTTVARLLAKAVNCVEGPTAEPCGTCDSCREIGDGSSIDVIEMDAATNTSVDDVRNLQDLVQFHPTRDRFRVIIVDEVHMLSKSAFNALLKTIEEPPPYIVWIFATTERVKVPDTILSRCQQLEFRPVGTDLIRDRLQQIARDEDFDLAPSAAAAIAAAAEGSVRDALSLLDQLRAFAADAIDDEAVAAVIGVPPVEVIAGLLHALVDGRTGDALSLLRQQLTEGRDASALYQATGRTIRTALHLAVDPQLEAGLADTHRQLLQPLAEGVGADGLSRMLGVWLDHLQLMRDTANRELVLEVVALRMARWPAVRALEAWLAAGETVPPESPSGGPPSAASGPSSGTAPPPDRSSEPTPAASAEVEARGSQGSQAVPAIEIEAERRALAEAAANDPGVELASRVLGGEVVAVRRDRETS
jgi:DNA polymerase-3 subunit gamma/tau